MTSFMTPRVFSPAAVNPMPASVYSCDKVSYSYSVAVVPGVRSRKKAMQQPLSVRAMAVAKFKGTWMREKQLTEMIEKKVMEAKGVCKGNEASDECKVAWDEVEEVSRAKADLRRKMEKHDPLEYFCQENPETDECRIYED
ncbi:calvin cycle protein CP12-3, chloroplastic [Telopea speciosissima]|uniref:calvin cycle protein CP12-3, chloroplastic n=1 Tax=Telopea speciosissima TaxID=54955 RepID=UPI001CC43C68|nr:calvin cycle protein CP12-3, chloroplastic [Telopea speciosissima]